MKKIIIILVFIMACFLSNCEKEAFDGKTTQQNEKFKYLTGNDAQEKFNLLNKELTSSKSKKLMRSDEYGTVKTDIVMQIIDSLGNKTFTFRVDHPDANDRKFFNMVLRQNIDGLTMAKLYEYNMTADFSAAFYSGQKSIKDFQGTYNYKLAAYSYS